MLVNVGLHLRRRRLRRALGVFGERLKQIEQQQAEKSQSNSHSTNGKQTATRTSDSADSFAAVDSSARSRQASTAQ